MQHSMFLLGVADLIIVDFYFKDFIKIKAIGFSMGVTEEGYITLIVP